MYLRGGMHLSLHGGLNAMGFGGDSSITHTRKSRAVSPPIDTDILGSDDEDSGVLQNKLKEVFGACARPAGTPPPPSAVALSEELSPGSPPRRFVFILSDRTGFTASHILTAVLYQFGLAGDNVVTQVFSNVRSMVKISRIVALAQRIEAFICFTFLDPHLRRSLAEHCSALNVHSMDVLGDLVDGLSTYLEAVPVLYQTQPAPPPKKAALTPAYFKRIEAVDFAIKQDDGANPQNLKQADMIILGVSRVQKTPMSTYLAQQFGLKVANVKLQMGMPLDPELAEVDPRRIFALTCQADYLYKVRRRRIKMGGAGNSNSHLSSDYANLDAIKKELAWCGELFAQHPQWTVVDMTGASVEEASEVHIRPNLPRKPTPMEGALEALSQHFCVVKVDNNEIEQYEAEESSKWSRAASALRGPAHSASRSQLRQLDFDRIASEAAGTTECWWKGMQIMFISDGMCGLLGLDKEESKSYTIIDLCRSMTGPKTEESGLKDVLGALYTGREKTVTLTCHKPDDNYFTNKVHVSPIKNSAGNDVLVLVSMREMPFTDVTKAAAADDRLYQRLTKQSFHTILDATSEGLSLWYASKGFFKMTGYTEQEVLARHGQGASFALWGAGTLLGELSDHDLENVKESVAQGMAVNTCFKSYRKDGKLFWNMAHFEPVYDENGELRWYVGTHHAVLD